MTEQRFVVAVLGGPSGRGSALVQHLNSDLKVDRVIGLPGTADMSSGDRFKVDLTDAAKIKEILVLNNVDLVVIEPEAPLAAGLADQLKAMRLRCVGPGKAGARLESDKDFGKELMKEAKIKTARSFKVNFDEEAREIWRREFDRGPVYVKYNDLAAGKGALPGDTPAKFIEASHRMFVDREFGKGPGLVEEFLVGQEASVMLALDGTNAVWIGCSCDHKKLLDKDEGPNTGGMGAYSPSFLNRRQRAEIMDEIVRPLLRVFKERGIDYRGILYLGLMVTDKGIYVLEFNVRFGDPEAQAILMRLDSSLFDLLWATTEENGLEHLNVELSDDKAVVVIKTAHGYGLGDVRKGDRIYGLGEARRAGAAVFLAGAKTNDDGQIVTDGGRVVGIGARAKTFPEAIDLTYRHAALVHFEGEHCRGDIGLRAMAA